MSNKIEGGSDFSNKKNFLKKSDKKACLSDLINYGSSVTMSIIGDINTSFYNKNKYLGLIDFKDISKEKELCIKNSIIELDSDFLIDKLEGYGFDYSIIKSLDLTKKEKEKILSYFMRLYKNNYEEYNEKMKGSYSGFILENRNFIIDSLNDKDSEFHMLYLDHTIYLTTFFKKIDEETLYCGGFNKNNEIYNSNIGFKFLKELINIKGKKNNIEGILTIEIEGVINKYYNLLLRKYSSLGFKIIGKGKTKYSKFIKMRRERDDDVNNS